MITIYIYIYGVKFRLPFLQVNYKLFAKAREWGKDLYDDLVAPSLETALNVETWRNGAGGRLVVTRSTRYL